MTSKQSELSPVESLSSVLTAEQISTFIQKAIPSLKLAQTSLQLSLETHLWEDAAKQAHQLKSTVGLFSVDELVESLDLIEAGNAEVTASPEFRKSFMDQCQDLIDRLERYLRNT